MATNRKSLAPALMFFTCVIFQIISMIISSSRFGYFHYNFINIIVSIILPLALGAICFINSRSKALPPLYLVYALSRLFLDGFNVIGRNNGVIYSIAGDAVADTAPSLSAVNITTIFVAVIFLLLFALTFLKRSFRTSNAGLICKLLLLLLAVVVVVMTIIRIRFLFRPYFNPAYLNNCIISINAVYLLLKN